jgi:ATP-dependent RNA helicase RhlE
MPNAVESQPVSFADLPLSEPILASIRRQGYVIPTPIQAQAIGPLLEGRDLLGRAQTGSGKTAAFALPMIQMLTRSNRRVKNSARSLVVTPTRELAVQIEQSFKTYASGMQLSVAVVYGGVSQVPQVDALRRGVDVLVATPGRLLDLVSQRHIKLDAVEIFVLDEADRMLDMGFIPDIRRIVGLLPSRRQTLFFSATIPPKASQLANDMLSNPLVLNIEPERTTADNIDQKVMLVEREHKRDLLCQMLGQPDVTRALVFTRTKHGADNVVRRLRKQNIEAEAIHGDRTQVARQKALDEFRSGRTRVLVATDVASRGIDVDGISHVFNYELPDEAEVYVHRIGRTARAGASGIAYSFCDVEERGCLREIEKLIRRPLAVVADHPFQSSIPYIAYGEAKQTPASQRAQMSISRRGRRSRIHR